MQADPTLTPPELTTTPRPRRNTSWIIDRLASDAELTDDADSAAVFRAFGVRLHEAGLTTVEDITHPELFAPAMDQIMHSVQGFTAGHKALFSFALDPTRLMGFEWPDPPLHHQALQAAAVPGSRKRKGPAWSTAPQFVPMSLPADKPVPSLCSLGVFGDRPAPADTGTTLADGPGYKHLNELIFSAAQRHPELQGGGILERVRVQWEHELNTWCPPALMPMYGKKIRRHRAWDLQLAFSNRRRE